MQHLTLLFVIEICGSARMSLRPLRDMIKPEDVIAAVKAYIEDMSVEAGPVGVSTAVSGNTKSSQEEIRIAQRRLASMRNYWVQLGQIVNDDSVSVWKQLEQDSINCKQLLQKRASSIVEVNELTRRNAELKSLLNQYLGDNVTNATFRVPPAQVMKVRDVGGTMGSSVGGDSNTYNSTTGGGLGKAGGSGLMDNMLGAGSITAKGGKNVLPKKAKQGYSKTQ